ncbi:MAG TPA: NADH-dependent [FeFe] hydrogenase, group A6 [Elusimicrobiota bacterium]|nr:NADH-dependent [FeFe] hydrogenase, group A6 [Elusimicrobiota bacterium]
MIEVNGQKIECKPEDTVLTALQRAGIFVPTLCYLPDLFANGACRMCVVEVEGQRNLIPSCAFPVAENMKVSTHSPRVLRARKTIIELLCSNHPDDCLYCGRNGSCELQRLTELLGVRERRYTGERSRHRPDVSNPSIARDPAKCILCGRCVRVCETTQSVSAIDFIGRGSRTKIGTAFDAGLNVSSCINCGQCIKVCPTGALSEQSSLKEVHNALADPHMTVVVQHAPSVSVTLAEEFGMKPGVDVNGVMVTALRRLGFDKVFDTSFSADLTIMEEASEFAHRLTRGGVLPMFTSCSPGWIKFVEQFYPKFLPNLSTCKSPQQMMGAVVKSYFAKQAGLDPHKIFSVSVMPCTAKKFEAQRPEMLFNGLPDVDAVLTTRELAQMIRMRGLDLNALEPDTADTPFGSRSTAGKIFGASGGVMEAALRTAHHLITGKELEALELKAIRGMDGLKEASLRVGDVSVNVAVVSGLGNARKLMEEIASGARPNLHFVEVMTCPGGCVNGGGQPYNASPEAVRARMQALYRIDREEKVRTSHGNKSVQRLYEEFLEKPCGKKSHQLLHTRYHAREEVAL